MPPIYFPLRWESTGDQWWCASPIDWAMANGHYDLVHELLRLDGNHLIKLTSLRRIRRLESVWDDEEQFHDVAMCRSLVARKLLFQCDTMSGDNSLIQAGYGGWFMYTAASGGDLGFVQQLLERNPLLVFGEGEYGVTDILYAASRSKNSEVFRLLFDFAVSPRFVIGKGGELKEHIPSVYKWEIINRAVHSAASGGNLKILKDLIADHCFDVLAYRDVHESTILHTAAGMGQVQVLNYLIDRFDIINSTDHEGNTALHVAAHKGQLGAVEALISTSPSSVYSRNNAGETFLHKVVSGFQTHSFWRLDKQIDLLKQLVCVKILKIQDIINAKNNEKRTALHMAIIGNINPNLVKFLMTAQSIDVNVRDANEMTPLDYLRQRPQSASSDILIRQLIAAGGMFSCQDYTARKVIASRLKKQSNGISPGTSFRISDQEILFYTGIEQHISNSSNLELGRSRMRSFPVEQSSCDSTNVNHISFVNTKPGSMKYAAERVKRVLHWPKIKEKETQKFKQSVQKNSDDVPTQQTETLFNVSELPNNKTTFSVRCNQSNARGRSSHSCSFSKSSIPSPTSLDKQKGVCIENDIAEQSGSYQVDGDYGTPYFVKQGYAEKSTGLSVKTPVSRQQLNQDFKRPVASVA